MEYMSEALGEAYDLINQLNRGVNILLEES